MLDATGRGSPLLIRESAAQPGTELAGGAKRSGNGEREVQIKPFLAKDKCQRRASDECLARPGYSRWRLLFDRREERSFPVVGRCR